MPVSQRVSIFMPNNQWSPLRSMSLIAYSRMAENNGTGQSKGKAPLEFFRFMVKSSAQSGRMRTLIHRGPTSRGHVSGVRDCEISPSLPASPSSTNSPLHSLVSTPSTRQGWADKAIAPEVQKCCLSIQLKQRLLQRQ